MRCPFSSTDRVPSLLDHFHRFRFAFGSYYTSFYTSFYTMASDLTSALHRKRRKVSFADYGRLYILHHLEYDAPPWIPPGLHLSWVPRGKEWRKLTEEEITKQDMPKWWEEGFVFPDIPTDGDSDFGVDEDEGATFTPVPTAPTARPKTPQKNPKKHSLREKYQRFPPKKR